MCGTVGAAVPFSPMDRGRARRASAGATSALAVAAVASAHFRRLWVGRHGLAARRLGRPPRPHRARARAHRLARPGRRPSPRCRWPASSGIGQVLATLADRYGRVAVMLAADVARAALFLAMLLDVPVGALLVLAFLAGLATPPFEAARSAALPDLVPEERYGDALALVGISVQSVAGARLRARRRPAHARRPRGGPRHQRAAASSCRRRCSSSLRHTRGRPTRPARRPRVGALARRRRRHRSSATGWCGGPSSIVVVTGRLRHRGRGPRRALRRRTSACPTAASGCSPRPSRSARCSAPRSSPAAARPPPAAAHRGAGAARSPSAAAAPALLVRGERRRRLRRLRHLRRACSPCRSPPTP